MDVYVSCNIEICANDCENSCQPEVASPEESPSLTDNTQKIRQQQKQKPQQHQVHQPAQQQPLESSNSSNFINPPPLPAFPFVINGTLDLQPTQTKNFSFNKKGT